MHAKAESRKYGADEEISERRGGCRGHRPLSGLLIRSQFGMIRTIDRSYDHTNIAKLGVLCKTIDKIVSGLHGELTDPGG